MLSDLSANSAEESEPIGGTFPKRLLLTFQELQSGHKAPCAAAAHGRPGIEKGIGLATEKIGAENFFLKKTSKETVKRCEKM